MDRTEAIIEFRAIRARIAALIADEEGISEFYTAEDVAEAARQIAETHLDEDYEPTAEGWIAAAEEVLAYHLQWAEEARDRAYEAEMRDVCDRAGIS